MWILLLVTTLNTESPQYDFKQIAATKTMTECIRMMEKYRFEDAIKQQIYCIKAK